MFGFFRWVIGIITAAGLVYIVAINPQEITLNWSPAHDPLDIPLYVIIIAAFILAFLIGVLHLWFGQTPKIMKIKRECKTHQKRIKDLETQIDNYESSQNILRD